MGPQLMQSALPLKAEVPKRYLFLLPVVLCLALLQLQVSEALLVRWQLER